MTGQRGQWGRAGAVPPCSLRAVLRSLPGPGLHPWRILAVPEVRWAAAEGIPREGSPLARTYRLPSHGTWTTCPGCSGSDRPPGQPWETLLPTARLASISPSSKDESGFAAPPLVSQGVAVVAVGYDTAPKGRCCPAEVEAACAGPAPF